MRELAKRTRETNKKNRRRTYASKGNPRAAQKINLTRNRGTGCAKRRIIYSAQTRTRERKRRNAPPPPTPTPPITTPKLSPALISVNETKTISLAPDKSLFELLREEAITNQENKTFKRIGVLKNEKEFMSSVELLQNLEVAIPPFTLSYIKGNHNLLIYNQPNGKRLGLIAEIENPENFKEQLRIWEGTMLDDFKNFYPIQVPGPRASQTFLNDVYLNVAIRYVNLPKSDLTLNYTIMIKSSQE